MIEINIPGWGNLGIENIVLDLNGTIAMDGKIPVEVKEKIHRLSQQVNLHVLTADTQGTATEEVRDMPVALIRISEEKSKEAKFESLKKLNPETTVVIGNGNNDQLILKEAALGIIVLGEEGMSVFAMKHADVVVGDISNALDLFLRPKRLIATLRE